MKVFSQPSELILPSPNPQIKDKKVNGLICLLSFEIALVYQLKVPCFSYTLQGLLNFVKHRNSPRTLVIDFYDELF
jgi:hypothetical protein